MTRGSAAPRGLTELASGVFVYAVPGPIPVNAGIVVGDEAAAVIDTGTVEADATSILAAVRAVTERPVRYVVNTHYHGDHTFGNWWFLPALTIGHGRCRLRLLGEAGAGHREMLARFVPMAREQIAAVPVVAPALTFEQQVRLHLGPLVLRMDYFGRAHTDNDVAITVEEAGLVFAGDLIEESGPPVAFEAFPADWGATLRRLEAVTEPRFVPGHGRDVDRAFVTWQRSGLEALAAACAAAGSAEAARRAAPAVAREVLGPQTEVAIERYFATTGAEAAD